GRAHASPARYLRPRISAFAGNWSLRAQTTWSNAGRLARQRPQGSEVGLGSAQIGQRADGSLGKAARQPGHKPSTPAESPHSAQAGASNRRATARQLSKTL
ncbi:MAG TPA: hypothetical protein VF460_15530, partial [Burkholderiales bacterium]